MRALILLTNVLLVGCVTLSDSFAGAYEGSKGGDAYRYVFLEGGTEKIFRNGKIVSTPKWSIKNSGFLDARGQVHVEDENGDVGVFRINPDGSITHVAYIINGKRGDVPEDEQTIFKKVK